MQPDAADAGGARPAARPAERVCGRAPPGALTLLLRARAHSPCAPCARAPAASSPARMPTWWQRLAPHALRQGHSWQEAAGHPERLRARRACHLRLSTRACRGPQGRRHACCRRHPARGAHEAACNGRSGGVERGAPRGGRAHRQLLPAQRPRALDTAPRCQHDVWRRRARRRSAATASRTTS